MAHLGVTDHLKQNRIKKLNHKDQNKSLKNNTKKQYLGNKNYRKTYGEESKNIYRGKHRISLRFHKKTLFALYFHSDSLYCRCGRVATKKRGHLASPHRFGSRTKFRGHLATGFNFFSLLHGKDEARIAGNPVTYDSSVVCYRIQL